MTALPFAAMTLAVLGAPDGPALAEDGVHHVASSLEPEGELLGAELVDLDGDGRLEICLAVRTPAASRQLVFHRLRDTAPDPQPFRVVPVLDDALAYGFADVREEAGLELFFLTERGVWSYSLEHDGYRDNVRQLVARELIYDVPDPSELDAWKYVFRRGGDDWILLPGERSYAIWAPNEARAYVPIAEYAADWDTGSRRENADDEHTVRIGSGGLDVSRRDGDGGVFLAGPEEASDVFLSSQREYRAPALIDVDGDGARDLVTLTRSELVVHWNDGDAFDRRPRRVEPVPAYLDRDELALEFADLDGDGDPDLLAQCSDDTEGTEAVDVSLLALLNDGRRLLPEHPSQILRFETNDLSVHLTDVDGDGRIDLALRKFELPSLLDAITNVEFTITSLLFLGVEGARPFERKPSLKQSASVDEAGLVEQVASRALEMDCDGDGLADLVEIDAAGRVSIRRIVRKKSFFGATRWSLETSPWARFETLGSIESIEVRDVNHDGLGDVISRGPKALSLLLSVPGARGRKAK